MGGLCGWFGDCDGERSNRQLLDGMAAGLMRLRPGAVKAHIQQNVAVATTDGDLHREEAVIAAVSGKADFSDPQLRERASQQGFARTLAHLYRERGSDVLSELTGAFVVVLMKPREREIIVAIDRMGISPLTYTLVEGCLVFGSNADAVNLHPCVKPAIEPQAIYDYVYFHMVPGPATLYSGQQRLLPGQYLRLRDGKLDLQPYWEMRFEEHRSRPFEELREQFLSLMREAVRRAAAGNQAGAFLSGGTDSSTIAGMLGEVSNAPARSYSIGFEADGYDEMAYARIAAKHFGMRHHEYYVTPDDVVAAIPQIAAAHDQPFGNASAVPTFYCAKLAKADGIDTLLGGDELFGGNERYAKQHLYSLYSDLPGLLRKGLIEPAAFLLPAEIGIAGKVQRYIKNATVPMPARYDNYNLLERLGAATVFTPEFLDTVDQQSPAAQMAQAYDSAHARSLINRMLALDFRYTLADNDLPKVTRSCELAGIDVQYPMLDDDVVAFAAALAPGLKLKGTQLRYFFKRALRGYLPDEIITKTKHGFGLPFGPWMQTHEPLRQIALDSVADLKQRRIVRPEFIDELTSMHVQSHAGYYGTLVWVLMMLEQWFRQHRIAAK